MAFSAKAQAVFGTPDPFEEPHQMSPWIGDLLEDDDPIIRFLRFRTPDQNTSRDDFGTVLDERAENEVSNPEIEFPPPPDFRKAELDSPARPELIEPSYDSTTAEPCDPVEIQLEIQVLQTLAAATGKTDARDFLDLDPQDIGREPTDHAHRHGSVREQTTRRLLRRRSRTQMVEQRTPQAILKKRIEIDWIEIIRRAFRPRQSNL